MLEILSESNFIFIPASKLSQISPTANALQQASEWFYIYRQTATSTEKLSQRYNSDTFCDHAERIKVCSRRREPRQALNFPLKL